MWGKLKTKKRGKASLLAEGTLVYSGIKGQNAAGQKRIIASVLIGLALLGIGWFVYGNLNKKPAVVSTESCKDMSEKGILREASRSLGPTEHEQLKPVVERIRAIPNHENNPDCLNVITTYYINSSDYENARAYLDKLNEVYVPNQGFSKFLGPDAKNIETLRADVAFLEKQVEQFEKNKRPLLDNVSEP